MHRTRVLVVDDSALMRRLIADALAADPAIEVVGTAPDPLIARDKIKALDPDVVTLDIEMPRMDGLEFLRRLMALRPTRVLMVSTLTARNSDVTLAALELGAIDCLEKPRGEGESELAAFRSNLKEKVKAAAQARLGAVRHVPARQLAPRSVRRSRIELIAIGASTGGVEALHVVLREIPPGMPPIVIVQHMPAQFTGAFAKRLDKACLLEVSEGQDGAPLLPDTITVAPGGRQMTVVRRAGGLACRVRDGELVSGHAPSADVLFQSAAETVGAGAVGVILTGMGSDGARGLMAMLKAGANTLGQDFQTSLVYGMPRVAFEIGAVQLQLSLEDMAPTIADLVERNETLATGTLG